MRRGRSADSMRQAQDEPEGQGSQTSHANHLEELPPPPNPNEIIGTMATLIREQARAREAHLKQLEELYVRAQAAPRDHEKGSADFFDKFRKLGPTEFHGDSDPAVAEEWISSLEVIFEFMNIEDTEKVRCAIFMLKKDARKWWEAAKQGKDLSTMTWEQFKDVFYEKYFTADVRARRADQLYGLKHGDKTVAEYVRRFQYLVNYVLTSPRIPWIR